MSDKSWEPGMLLKTWKTHPHTLSLFHYHSLTFDMLNNFCFHVYAQKSLKAARGGDPSRTVPVRRR